jgi:hypothetical protein
MGIARGFVVASLLGTFALAACSGLTKSPAEGLNFKAPDGWKSTPGIMGIMQLWSSGTGKEVLMLFHAPADWKADQALDSANVKDAQVEEQRAVKICGDQNAQFVKMRATSTHGDGDQNVQMMTSKAVDGGTYLALYIYPIAAQPDAQAQAAIYELCPVKS